MNPSDSLTEQQRQFLGDLGQHTAGQRGEVAIGLDMASREIDWGICVLAVAEADSDPVYQSRRILLLLPQPRLNSSGTVSPTLLCRPSLAFLNAVLDCVRHAPRVSIAVDVPFGWSVFQASFLSNWSADGSFSTDRIADTKEFSLRLCDRALQGLNRGINPLPVGASRIASAAYRWATIRNQTPILRGPIDLGLTRPADGISIFETYPGAFVKLASAQHSEYKMKPHIRRNLAKVLCEAYDLGLNVRENEMLEWACEQNGSPDAFDAFLCALSALDHLRYRRGNDSAGLTLPSRFFSQSLTAEQHQQIQKEGWILVRSAQLDSGGIR